MALSRGGGAEGEGNHRGFERMKESQNGKKSYSSRGLPSLYLFQISERTGLYGMEEGVCPRRTCRTLSANRYKSSMIQVRHSSSGDLGGGTFLLKEWNSPQRPKNSLDFTVYDHMASRAL